jgi:DNA-binding NtrC family response regulator
VISDIRMPEMSGIELLGAIKELDSSIKVILITAFATLETAVEALKMGARDYITKPFDLEEVFQSVKRIVGTGKNLEDALAENGGHIENDLTAKSEVRQHMLKLLNQVAKSNATVLLYGETGTGKEIVSKTIRNRSDRREKAFVEVNCAAIPENLLESEFFGYEKGAFTGAAAKKPALISKQPEKRISREALQKLIAYEWPGNIRELENTIERCVVVTSGSLITLGDLPENILDRETPDTSAAEAKTLGDAVDSAEKNAILKVLEECCGNGTQVSQELGISRRSLHRKLLKYNIEDL